MKVFLWIRRSQFWEIYWDFFNRRPTFLLSRFKTGRAIIFFGKNLSSNCSHGHIKCSLDNAAGNFEWRLDNHVKNLTTKSRKVFHLCPKVMRNDQLISMKTFFSPECSHRHVETCFEYPAGKILPESRIFSLNFRKRWEQIKHFFSGKNSVQIVPVDK